MSILKTYFPRLCQTLLSGLLLTVTMSHGWASSLTLTSKLYPQCRCIISDSMVKGRHDNLDIVIFITILPRCGGIGIVMSDVYLTITITTVTI